MLFHDTVIDSQNTWFNDLTKAYVITGPVNVNAVLQIKISNLLPIISTAQLDGLSTTIAGFINNWITGLGNTVSATKIDFITKQLNFIGHGQGAHIAGKTGATYTRYYQRKLTIVSTAKTCF